MDKNKLGVIVPYRNRERHLELFKSHMVNYLDKNNIEYEIIIINQDNAKQFNRGMLLNIGFKYALKLKCNYVVFHDVDMIPVHVDYSYSDIPLHLANKFQNDINKNEIFDEYFGGVTIFPIDLFKKINGYSNKYWGWGYEDTDLLYRCYKSDIKLNTLNIKNMGKSGKAIKFNGIDSYIKVRNIHDLDYNKTFFISFYPDEIICDHTKETDSYTIFSIPGYDTSISYNSFLRYAFLTFDENKDALYINTKIKKNYKTNICVTIDNDNKIIKMFQDGIFVGESKITKKLLSYIDKRFFYLGVGDPDRQGDERFFKGYLTKFASYSNILTDEEIFEISTNEDVDFTENYKNYKSSKNLEIYFDANKVEKYEFKNLVSTRYNGKFINCEIVDLYFKEYTDVKIPYRRDGLFKLLKHDENGFFENKWKDQATRWNQLRFQNEVLNNDELLYNDGLDTLKFTEHGKTKLKNIIEINVGI